MTKAKKDKEVLEAPEGVAEPVESAEHAAFRVYIENYSKSNPVKYEMKKAALEKQLSEIK